MYEPRKKSRMPLDVLPCASRYMHMPLNEMENEEFGSGENDQDSGSRQVIFKFPKKTAKLRCQTAEYFNMGLKTEEIGIKKVLSHQYIGGI